MFKTDSDLGVFSSEGLLEPVKPFVVEERGRAENIIHHHVLLREWSTTDTHIKYKLHNTDIR